MAGISKNKWLKAGDVIGNFTLIRKARENEYCLSERPYWLIKCSCGITKVKSNRDIRNGKYCSKKCGLIIKKGAL